MYSPQRTSILKSPARQSPIKRKSPSESPINNRYYTSNTSPWRSSPTKRNEDPSMSLEHYLAMKQSRKRMKPADDSPTRPLNGIRGNSNNTTLPSVYNNRRSTILINNRKRPNQITANRAKPNLGMTSSPVTLPKKDVRSCITICNQAGGQDLKIRVCVRKRPLNKHEINMNEQDIAPLTNTRTIEIHAPKQKVDLTKYIEQHSFTFDDVFDCNTSNRTIYQQTTRPLVEHMFKGGKATCFAYGQTGSGKTFTMLNPKHGLYFQAITDIFKLLNNPHYSHLQAWVGYYEIYQGQLFDLLNSRKKLVPREDGKGNIIISGLKEYHIHSSSVMKQVFDFGNRERTTSKTETNEASSRSHAILQILLKQTSNHAVYGKLNFIDLAGSERGTDRGSNSDTKTRMEGAEINRSLLALKECIRALDQDKRHAPFRGSKLTMVLRDSFIGNSKTCMIATISPNHSNSDHTLNTLRYADRVKELKGESDPRLLNTTTTTTNNVLEESSLFQKEQDDPMLLEPEITISTTITNDNTSQSTPTVHIPIHHLQPPPKLTKRHINNFIHSHKIQVEAFEAYIRSSNELIAQFERDFEYLTRRDDERSKQLLKEKFENYQQELSYKGSHVDYFLQNLKSKVKAELVDDDEEDH
ncbi:P-loop containing nucleoside triphosphate hydrolase protein [Cokeromyces recurvatus]|uniref:P-loop containing nucleoside triphosphate hydrolase protein n=1 Tax=Cokeromyces recurvatus TaxID=90255 RepID=UPI00221FC507|nr:P-loop containing nucleoside triphosphate hydrolase protein [Cokeromyces recurvatus]KAI7899305.1 P-loop containing nucleoside triphosphate hydrolase protein [Cokeromyces recurvatus]